MCAISYLTCFVASTLAGKDALQRRKRSSKVWFGPEEAVSIRRGQARKYCMSIAALYLEPMELTYPINLVGFDDGAEHGEVLSRDGEFLGIWMFIKDHDNETGVLHFVADGENEPMFSKGVSILSSGMRTGMAMSELCRSIRDWHEA